MQKALMNVVEVIIAGAGGAAHLPGMTAAKTHLPVIGVPVKTKALEGKDSLLSIVQMPAEHLWPQLQSERLVPQMQVYFSLRYSQ